MSGLLFWVCSFFFDFSSTSLLFACVSGFCQVIFSLFRAFAFSFFFFLFLFPPLLGAGPGLPSSASSSSPLCPVRRSPPPTGRNIAARLSPPHHLSLSLLSPCPGRLPSLSIPLSLSLSFSLSLSLVRGVQLEVSGFLPQGKNSLVAAKCSQSCCLLIFRWSRQGSSVHRFE